MKEHGFREIEFARNLLLQRLRQTIAQRRRDLHDGQWVALELRACENVQSCEREVHNCEDEGD